jgi:hypothetical protein
MREINNIRRQVIIDKELDAEVIERLLIENVKYLIGDHLKGRVSIAVESGDEFEYELKFNRLKDTESHWCCEIELDRAHIWHISGKAGER